MKKLILSIILTVSILFTGAVPYVFAQNGENSVTAEIVYGEESSKVQITGSTSVKYAPLISVLLYEIDASEIEGLKEEDGSFSLAPAKLRPLADAAELLRIGEIRADYSGNFATELSLQDVEDQQYMIVKIQGGGLEAAGTSFSKLLYYEKQTTIDEVTLPAFNSADAEAAANLIQNKQVLLDYVCDRLFSENKSKIGGLFVSVRSDDFPEGFEKIDDVKKALKTVDALLMLSTAPTGEETESIITNYNLDADYADTDYTENKSAVSGVLSKFLTHSDLLPVSREDMSYLMIQATGVAMLTSHDATQLTPIIRKYKDYLGIDEAFYDDACEEYGADLVNAGLVEHDFTRPDEINSAIIECVDALEEERETNSSGGNGGSSGGGGSFGGGNSANKPSDAPVITPTIEEDVTYNDLEKTHWAYSSIQKLSAKGFINGMPDGTFRPEETVTREQFVTMIVKAFDIQSTDVNLNFSDVERGRWSFDAIRAAYNNGIIKGITDSLFNPDGAVTRQDAAVIIARACKLKTTSLKEGTSNFTDWMDVSEYAKDAVGALSSEGLLAGFPDGSFKPQDTLTRAQAAKLIYSVYERGEAQ